MSNQFCHILFFFGTRDKHEASPEDELREASKLNKHKFVQKVAKKNILLVHFGFSINISSVRYTGVKINKVIRY